MKLTTRKIREFKKNDQNSYLQMLTCYDYQTAGMLNQTNLDLILVGDSLGNVVLGHETTIEVTLDEMIIFGRAVKRGAPDKFTVVDMPFGTYNTLDEGLRNGSRLFQETGAEAIKLEGAFPHQLELIQRLTQIGVPVMGHIGLRPQSVHQMGGYYVHGKNNEEALELVQEAKALEQHGAFSVVLECVAPKVSYAITRTLKVPTIGIGSGGKVDGQVMVINDLLNMSDEKAPGFVRPIANLFQLKKELINTYLRSWQEEDNLIDYPGPLDGQPLNH